jgi:hypothetical protein
MPMRTQAWIAADFGSNAVDYIVLLVSSTGFCLRCLVIGWLLDLSLMTGA